MLWSTKVKVRPFNFLNALCVHNPFIFVFLYLQSNDNSFSIPINLLLIPPEEEASLEQMSGKPNKKPSQFPADTVCKTRLTFNSLWLTISCTFPCSSLHHFFPSWNIIPLLSSVSLYCLAYFLGLLKIPLLQKLRYYQPRHRGF